MSGAGSLEVDCPTCGRRTEYSPANPWRPFCGERCKKIDLGAWASDEYVVPGSPLEDAVDPDAEGVTPPPRGQRR